MRGHCRTALKSLPLGSLLLLAAFAGRAQITDQDLAKADSNNWLSYSGSYDGRRHTSLKQIDTGNVQSLTAKWIYHMPGPGQLEDVPIVAEGVMYVSQSNAVRALDGGSGRLIWEYQRPVAARGKNRGLAIYDNKIYFGTTDATLMALDARTGSVIWETKMPGESLRYQGGAPLVARGKVIVGVNSPSGGFVDAYDARTGAYTWRWHAIPKPGETGSETWNGDSWKLGGGPTWLTGGYDART